MKYNYAINLSDWHRCKDDLGLHILLDSVVDKDATVECEGRGKIDGTAIPIGCDAERADAIKDVIRMKYKKHQVRVYRRGERGGWARV